MLEILLSLGKACGSLKYLLGSYFFVWVASLGKNLTAENLRKRNIILVNWCCLCKGDGEIVDQLLLHCHFLREFWDMMLALFGVQWVMPQKVVDVLACWQGSYGRHRYSRIWMCIPHCLMWYIWRERNAGSFEGCALSVLDLKLLTLKTLDEWVSIMGCFSCSDLAEFLDLCSFRA